jgi:HSP20 family protein
MAIQECTDPQRIPVKLYRTEDKVTVAAPMPGLEAENIEVEITPAPCLVLRGALRGALKDVKELVIDEWSVGPYERAVELPGPVDGEAATVTYGNGVVVVALPVAERTRPARLTLEATTPTRGERVPPEHRP